MGLKSGYKQTDVGVIPVDWSVPSLGGLVRSVEYGSSAKSEVTGAIPVLRMGNLQGGKIDWRDLVYTDNAAEISRYLLRPGDVLFNRTNTIDLVGKTSIYEGEQPAIFAGYLIRISVIPELLDSRYLNYVLNTEFARKYSAKVLSVAIGQANINGQKLKSYPIPLPPTKREQEAIAKALSDADELINFLDRLIAKKRQIKQGTMQELLTGKKRLPGFSGKWETLSVQDVVFGYFCGPSPTCEERNIEDNVEWGVLKTTAITWEHGWDWTKHKVLPKVFWNQPEIEVRPGDVIVTKAGPRHRVGVTAWVDEVPQRILVSGKMIGLRLNLQKAVPLILASAIASKEAQRFLDQRTTGMAESQVNFENSALMQAPILLPKIEEQTAIAAVLSDMAAEITALETKLAKARQVKQGMMQELLTGRVRLV